MGRSKKSGKHGQSLSRLAESTTFITLPFMQIFIVVGQQLGVGQLSLVRKFVDQLGPATSKKYVRTRICPP